MFISNSGSRGYQIANSLRLRSSASAYLSRTFGTPTNRNKWTWSAWVKRGSLGGTQTLLHGNGDNTANNEGLILLDSDSFRIYSVTGGTVNMNIVSSAVLRDPSAWYHLVAVFDSAQATAANRAMLYVNGVQLTSFSTNTIPAQNYVGMFNASGMTHEIGLRLWASDLKFDGYISEQYFIDGQALTPSSFGQTDTNGVWVPKAYSGTYGTNGFYLKFNDGSNTTNLCLDRSGNGNNWTPSGISVSAGSTYDWSSDTPTNVYCVLNPLDTSSGVMAEGNLAFTSPGVGYGGTRATVGVSSGKWYWEVTANAMTGGLAVGISSANEARPAVPGESAASYCYQSDALKRNNLTPVAYGATWTTNDVIGVALDLDAGTLVFYKNNTSQGTAYSSISGTFLPMVSDINNSAVSSAYVNFGQRPFTYTPPTGFKALCTANLPAVTIPNGKKHFDVLTHAGNGGTQSLTSTQFQPDFVWIKSRSSGTQSHQLFDSVRGVSKNLNSSNTGAEASTPGTGLTAFNSNGITLIDDAAGNNWVNGSTGSPTYVDWLWKANGAGVTNTSGSITSTVSANTTAGFSIVTYTGTGANATVGHGLGTVPKMVIVKARNASGYNFIIYHASMGATPQNNYIQFNTSGLGTTITAWNNTAPTSSVFSIGTSVEVNGNTTTFVAYCFSEIAGYSKFGSYTGNGSTDGPFVFCGFRPRYVLIKETGNANSWELLDTARSTYNSADARLFPNDSLAEATTAGTLDILSNGFKPRVSNTGVNRLSGTYIFMALAEAPFGASNTSPAVAR